MERGGIKTLPAEMTLGMPVSCSPGTSHVGQLSEDQLNRKSVTPEPGPSISEAEINCPALESEMKKIGRQLEKRNHHGETGLHTACKRNKSDLLAKLLSHPDADVNVRDYAGWTPLHEACHHGNVSCVEQLLRFLPRPFKQQDENKDVLRMMTRKDNGRSRNSNSEKVNSMEMVSVDNNSLRMVDLNATGPEDFTALHKAVLGNHVSVCRLLLEKGGQHLLEARTVLHNNALDLAQTDEIRELLQSFSNSNCSPQEPADPNNLGSPCPVTVQKHATSIFDSDKIPASQAMKTSTSDANDAPQSEKYVCPSLAIRLEPSIFMNHDKTQSGRFAESVQIERTTCKLKQTDIFRYFVKSVKATNRKKLSAFKSLAKSTPLVPISQPNTSPSTGFMSNSQSSLDRVDVGKARLEPDIKHTPQAGANDAQQSEKFVSASLAIRLEPSIFMNHKAGSDWPDRGSSSQTHSLSDRTQTESQRYCDTGQTSCKLDPSSSSNFSWKPTETMETGGIKTLPAEMTYGMPVSCSPGTSHVGQLSEEQLDRKSVTPEPGPSISEAEINCPARQSEMKKIGRQLEKRNHHGETGLHTACKRNKSDWLAKLLSHPDADINVRDYAGWTPLHEACHHGNVSCVEQLLRFLPRPFKQQDENKDGLGIMTRKDNGRSRNSNSEKVNSMEMVSVDNNSLRMVDLNATGPEDFTALHKAVIGNHVSVCRLLLEKGGQRLLEARTVLHNNALDLAQTDEIRELLQSFSNSNCRPQEPADPNNLGSPCPVTVQKHATSIFDSDKIPASQAMKTSTSDANDAPQSEKYVCPSLAIRLEPSIFMNHDKTQSGRFAESVQIERTTCKLKQTDISRYFVKSVKATNRKKLSAFKSLAQSTPLVPISQPNSSPSTGFMSNSQSSLDRVDVGKARLEPDIKHTPQAGANDAQQSEKFVSASLAIRLEPSIFMNHKAGSDWPDRGSSSQTHSLSDRTQTESQRYCDTGQTSCKLDPSSSSNFSWKPTETMETGGIKTLPAEMTLGMPVSCSPGTSHVGQLSEEQLDRESLTPEPGPSISEAEINCPARQSEMKKIGRQLEKRNHHGETGLHTACKRNKSDWLAKLLSHPDADINVRDYAGWTPLHEACHYGNVSCVEQLLRFLPRPFKQQDENKDVLRMMTRKDNGRSRNSNSEKVNSMEMVSVDNNSLRMVDLNATGPEDFTALHKAVLGNHVSVCRLLLEKGGQHLLEARTVLHNNALDLAQTDEIRELLQSFSNSNCSPQEPADPNNLGSPCPVTVQKHATSIFDSDKIPASQAMKTSTSDANDAPQSEKYVCPSLAIRLEPSIFMNHDKTQSGRFAESVQIERTTCKLKQTDIFRYFVKSVKATNRKKLSAFKSLAKSTPLVPISQPNTSPSTGFMSNSQSSLDRVDVGKARLEPDIKHTPQAGANDAQQSEKFVSASLAIRLEPSIFMNHKAGSDWPDRGSSSQTHSLSDRTQTESQRYCDTGQTSCKLDPSSSSCPATVQKHAISILDSDKIPARQAMKSSTNDANDAPQSEKYLCRSLALRLEPSIFMNHKADSDWPNRRASSQTHSLSDRTQIESQRYGDIRQTLCELDPSSSYFSWKPTETMETGGIKTLPTEMTYGMAVSCSPGTSHVGQLSEEQLRRESLTPEPGPSISGAEINCPALESEMKKIGRQLEKRNHHGETGLHTACKRNKSDWLAKLLSHPDADVNVRDYAGWTPLHEACHHGNVSCVEQLLRFLPRPFKQQDENKDGLGMMTHKDNGRSRNSNSEKVNSMEMVSVDNNSLRMVDLNATGPEDFTALHKAVLGNHVSVCRLLLEKGGQRLLEARTVLHYKALDLAQTDEIRELLQSFSNSNCCPQEPADPNNLGSPCPVTVQKNTMSTLDSQRFRNIVSDYSHRDVDQLIQKFK